MDDKYNLIISTLGAERTKKAEKLAHYTYSQSGGPADIFYIATNQRELIESLDITYELGVPFTLLGNGTKTVISEKGIRGFVIKNRTGVIKISGIKGKVGQGGLGLEEALIEVDSGVSMGKLNEYLKTEKLEVIDGISSENSSLGGSIFIDPNLKRLVQKIKVWDEGEVLEIPVDALSRMNHIVISAILKVKAAS